MSESDDTRLSALYRRIPRDEPDAQTDRRILAAAHAAVTRRSRRRYAPLAIAASLVLAAGIGLRILHEAPVGVSAPMSKPADRDGETALRKSSSTMQDTTPLPTPPAVNKGAAGMGAGQAPAESEPKRRLRQQAAPAAALSTDRVDAFGAAPMGRAELPPEADCAPAMPADKASHDAWQRAIGRAREAGDDALLDCLERRYRQQFNAIIAPMPDR